MHYWHEQHTLARKGKFLLAWSWKLGTWKKPHIQCKFFEELVILGSNTTRFNAQIYSEHMFKSHLQSQPESWMEPKTANHLFPPVPVKIPLNAAVFKVLLEIHELQQNLKSSFHLVLPFSIPYDRNKMQLQWKSPQNINF